MICWLDTDLFDAVSREAAARPRLRANHNLHAADDSAAHRLLNAIEPDSYLPPHRHLDAAKDETIVVLRGALAALSFDDAGEVLQTRVLTPAGDCCGIDVPYGTWHTVIALQPGTVIFEAKGGPFRPLLPAEKASWAPAEGAPEAATYLAALRARLALP